MQYCEYSCEIRPLGVQSQSKIRVTDLTVRIELIRKIIKMKGISVVILLGICVGIPLGVWASDSDYVHAVVESCSGCSLNRLPDVKAFIFEDLPLYDRTEFKHIQGAVPELVLYDKNNEEKERLPLSKLTREDCNNLLKKKGFSRKSPKDEI